LGGQCADHVVGFETLGAAGADAERVEELGDHLDLRRQVVGNLLDIGLPAGVLLSDPMGLVRRDAIDPELRSPVQVQTDHQPVRFVSGDHGGY
jgi:hypothetical protein